MSEACLLVDRSVVRIRGADARSWLQDLITNNMDLVSEERSIYAALLTPQGKILFDFFVLQDGDGFILDVEASRSQDLIKRLTLYKLRSQVDIEAQPDRVIVATYGSDALAKLGHGDLKEGATQTALGGIAVVDPRDTRMGLRVVGAQSDISDALDAALVALSDAEHYHMHRLSLGIPNASADLIPDKAFVLESNLDQLNGVDFSKGCFIGQEVTARTKHRGNVRKSILPVTSKGPLPPPGTVLKSGEVEVGTMLSGVGDQGLALMRTDRLSQVDVSSIIGDDSVISIEKLS